MPIQNKPNTVTRAEQIIGLLGPKALSQGQLTTLLGCSTSACQSAITMLRYLRQIHVSSYQKVGRGWEILYSVGNHPDAPEPRVGAADRLLAEMKKRDMTLREIWAHLGVSKTTAAELLRELRAKKLAHVHSIENQVRIYRAGYGIDATGDDNRKKRHSKVAPADIPKPDPLLAALFPGRLG